MLFRSNDGRIWVPKRAEDCDKDPRTIAEEAGVAAVQGYQGLDPLASHRVVAEHRRGALVDDFQDRVAFLVPVGGLIEDAQEERGR